VSYCQIVEFRNGKATYGPEFRNAWGGAAFIWDALFNKYIKDPMREYHTWVTDEKPLWALAKRKDLPMFERVALAATFDWALVMWVNFKTFASDIRTFVAAHPEGNKVCHLSQWADFIEKSDADAIGFHHTSVSENPWFTLDEEKEEDVPYDISTGEEHWDIYSELNKTDGGD